MVYNLTILMRRAVKTQMCSWSLTRWKGPRLSCGRRSQELKIAKSSVHSILRSDLHLTSFLVPVKQALSERGILARREMSDWFLKKMEGEREWIDHVWVSDEPHFCL